MTETADTQLVRRIQAGDPRALDSLIERYEPHLLNYVFRVTGDAATAESVFRQVMAEVAREAVTGKRGAAELRVELFKRARAAMASSAGSFTQELQMQTPLPRSAGAQGPELAARARQGLSYLPRARREAVVLKLFHRLTYEEVAAVTGGTPAQARYEVEVGLARLAEMLL